MKTFQVKSRIDDLISGDSEMAGRIRAYLWHDTLGPIDDWSKTLLATVNLMLHSPFPTVLAWGREMVFLYNDAAIPTLAAKHPAALGQAYRDVFREAWELVGNDLEACFHEGKTAVRDNLHIPILIDGVLEDHYWSYSLIPVYESGRVVGVYDAFRNMTETVVSARRLRESEERLKLATEVSQIGVFLWDTVTDEGDWENDRMYEIFGRTREQGPLKGTAFLAEVVHPDSRDAFRTAVQHTIQSGQPLHFEGFIALPSGQQRCIEVRGKLRALTAGKDGVILGTVRDVTELRQAEHAQRDNAKHVSELAAIVASSDDVIVSKNLDGIITSWNDAATRVFGYSAEEMIGSSILRLIPEDLRSQEETILAHVRGGRRVENFETVRLTRDGHRIEASVTVSPVKDAEGRVIGASKILRDISARKRMEQSLTQSEKIAATGRMAATIAHEINNPLESIMNLLYLLRHNVTEEGATYLNIAEGELERVSHIAKQTLGYYRENANAAPVRLAEIVEQALGIYTPRCRAAGIAIETTMHSRAKLTVRRGEITQVISNLIANSINAMPSGGTLCVSLDDVRAPDGVTLRIADTGTGIPTDALPRVFEAFFTTRATVGTGIGLFISKQFIEGHGGRISIATHTAADAHGTEIEVFLPLHTTYEKEESARLASSSGAPQDPAASKHEGGKQMTVMHVVEAE